MSDIAVLQVEGLARPVEVHPRWANGLDNTAWHGVRMVEAQRLCQGLFGLALLGLVASRIEGVMFATTAINPAALVSRALVGAIVGCVWGWVLRSSRPGLPGHALIGAAGCCAGGIRFGFTGDEEEHWGSVPIAFVASFALVMAARAAALLRGQG